jgi:zinc-ribbon domain
MADRFCGECGKELSEDDRFCRNCGRPVHEAARVPTPEADVPVPPPPTSRQVGDNPTPPGGRSPDTAPKEWWQTRMGWVVAAYVVVASLLYGASEIFPWLTGIAWAIIFVGMLVVLGYVLYHIVLSATGDQRSRTQQG